MHEVTISSSLAFSRFKVLAHSFCKVSHRREFNIKRTPCKEDRERTIRTMPFAVLASISPTEITIRRLQMNLMLDMNSSRRHRHTFQRVNSRTH
jgi:hypothetical protein